MNKSPSLVFALVASCEVHSKITFTLVLGLKERETLTVTLLRGSCWLFPNQ